MINHFKYLLLIIFSSFSFATTIHVATTGSDDAGDGTEANPYATIQKGINNLSSGDTIIVYNGHYNGAININTGDIVIKSQNGNHHTSLNTVIYLGNYDALIEGFEISLDTYLSTDSNNGVHIDSGFLKFNDCNFSHFEADPGRFMFDNDYGNLIFNNVSMDSLTHSSDDFLNNVGYTKFVNSILNNSLGGLWAPTSYGEIIFSNSFLSDDFFVNNCQIDSAFNSTILKGDIKYYATNSILFTGFSPTISEVSYCLTPEYIAGDGNITSDPFFCDPGNDDYTLSENSPAVGSSSSGGNIGFFPIGCGVYDAIYFVSNNGSDENGDGSINNPYFSIQAAIDIANDFDTVKVDDGIYMENINLLKRVALVGESREGTIIDGSNSGRCVELGSGASISSFTLTNGQASGGAALFDQGGSLIDNLLIKNNKSTNVWFVPAGILVANSSEIKKCIFYRNEGWVSGVESYGDVNISNCIFNDNINIEEDGNSGWLFLRASGTTTLNGLTIVDNQMPYLFGTNGGGLSDFYLLNSIVNNNLSSDIDGNITVSYTNFQGGIDGDGNIDTNPFFCDPINNNYFLSENSPCVAAGIDGINMGAYGIGCESLIESLTINEIMNNPSAVSDSDGEWFEIYNNGDISHELNGWTIKDNGSDSHVISSSLIINPGEFKVLSNNSNQSTNGGLVVDYQYDGITLANGDDELVLIDPNGTVFDSVAYDGGSEFPDLTGASMGVIDAETDNNVGSNWQASTTAYGDGDLGTPGLPNFSSDINVELTTIDFDTVLVGESSDKVLTISNTGNTILVIDSIYISSGSFTLPFTETSVETSLDLTITFTPSAYGIVEDTLVIKTNDPDEGHLEIPLIAFGYVPSPNIVLESTSIDFGTVMDGLTETFNLKLRNTGDVELEIDTMYISGHDAYALGDYSNNVEAGDSSNIPIIFSPDDEAIFEATLNIIILNDPDVDSLGIPLNGVGGEPAPILVLSKDQIDFGEDLPIQETFSKQIKIYNQGLLPLEIEEILFDTNLVWSDFSDASVQPLDSITLSINFHSEVGIYYLDTKMEIILIDSVISVPIIGGYIAKIEETICKIGDGFEFNILFQNDFTIGTIVFSIVDYQNLIYVNNIEPLDRFENSIIDATTGEQADGEYFLLCYDFAGGFSPGSGSAFILTGQHSDTITQNQLVNLRFNAVEIGDQGANLINVNTNLFRSGSITFYVPPTAPEGLELIFDNGIHLTWNENTDANFSHFVVDKSYDNQFQTNDYTSIMVYENSYSDTSFSNGQTIYYRLSYVDSSGYVSDFTEIVSIEINLNVVDGAMTPEVYALHQNYPNPFNPNTTISYDLPEASVVSLSIYDLMGREIRTMINSEQTAGFKNIQWNATDNLGKSVPAGMYICTIQAGEFRQTRKMVLLK